MTDRIWTKARLVAGVAVAIGVLTVTQPARADDAENVIALTGIDVGGHSVYGYVGGVAGLAGPLTQSGPLARLWVDHLSYDFASGTRKVTARGFGESASGGYQWVYASGLISGYAGISQRNTSVPAGVTSREKGSKTEARFEADWFQQLSGNLKSEVIASLVTGTADYWARARLWYRTPMKIAVAPEFVYLGNPDFKAHRFGLAVQAPVASTVKATVDAGYEKNSHFAGGAYGGLALSIPF